MSTSTPVKALSVRQPWAFAILHAGKMIENRSWPCRHRGLLAVHASKGGSVREYASDARMIERLSGMRMPAYDQVPRGGIVGMMRVADCIAPSDYAHAIRLATGLGAVDVRWWDPEQSGIVIDAVAPFEHVVPCDGQLGIWQLDPDIWTRIPDVFLDPPGPASLLDRACQRVERVVTPHSIDSSFVGDLVVQLLTERQIGTADACEMIRKQIRLAVRGA